ncbi:uncharacterized protein LOC135707720 [Ochlerotatus camptorhynchus]|uniref:uncharacterized protein LOC135707720 n=1 Tax=Ochlerotatus camptorhynchus TaxID=644619 RepID=UPI0031D4C6CE
MYGRPEQLLYSLLEKVRKADPLKPDRLESFVHFGILVEQLCDHLEATNLRDHLVNPLLLQELVEKVPASTKMEWVRYKRHFPNPTLRTFSDFMSEKAADAKDASNHNTHSGEQQSVIFRMVLVTLYYEDRSVDAVAFLDEGSSLSLVEADLADHLGVKGVKQMLRLIWTANISRTERNSKRVNLRISAKGSSEKWPLRNAHTVIEMKLPVQSIRYSELAQKFDHLKDLPLADGLSGMPRILIGLDNIHLFAPIESRIGNLGEPIAVRSKLGWAVYGPNSNEKRHEAFVGHHEGECITNQELHNLLRDHFSVEDIGITASTVLESDDDQRAKAILESTTVRKGDRFETGLLWKSDNHHFPNSFPMALKRLKQLEKRLSNNVELADAYHHQISEYLRKGYAHKASPKELTQVDPGQIWYLPVSIVTNLKKPGKVRLVWDASAKVSGISLNSLLLKGPDLLASLVAVISQFRERQIGFGGDIMEMYHQMLVRLVDRLAQCFLYRKTPEEAPEVYVMDRCTFGSACSPCTAQFVKNRNAEEYAELYPDAAAAIIHKHYVDDYFDSTNTVQEAVKRALDVKMIHLAAGFHIRNWMSNSAEFLTQLGEAKPEQTAYFSHDKHAATERVLGIVWRPEEDVFTFPMTFKDELKPYTGGDVRPTKRTALKCLMSLFDPLGLVAPFIVHGKILLQEIWRTGSQWDDEISDECFQLWTRWIQLFPKIASLRIPRPYFGGMLLADNETMELHVFVDGSLQAYGCVVYLRVMDGSTPRISLAMAKSKVGPIKQLSVPRMELQAAVLGARMMNAVESNHSLAIKRRFLWTDSQAVLSWINSDQRKFKQFVSFRIGEILSLTNADDWRKIPSRFNIADDLTKWGRHFVPDADDEWFCGPKFLHLPEKDWPQEVNVAVVIAEELRASVLFHEIKLEVPVIDTSRISRWNVLVRTIGMVYRFISNCRRKLRQLPIEVVPMEPKLYKFIVASLPSVVKPLQQDEYHNAENCLWRAAQCDTYGDEIMILKKNKQLPLQNKLQLEKSSQLYTLSPFLDECNVLRMRGRTEAAEFLPYDVRFPVILPKNHTITLKLIEHFHKRFGHSNNETVVNKLRQHFVIANLRAGVRNVARNCQWCRVHKCHPVAPIMAPLPVQRLTPYLAPFSFVGLDYCGPLEVTIGRRTEKRWIAVFTCLTVRAVHLEVSYNLTTQSCLMAIRRFMGRRGAPLEMFSDNGTNLHGASKELCTLIRQIDEECAEAVTNARLKWRFNPPSAPHMGGVWERMVRSVKQAMRALDDGRKLTDEILQTTLVEAEEMINSRPLTYQPQEAEGSEALSPNHFLRIGPSNGQLVETETELAEALRDTYRRSQYLADQMWKRWLNEYLPSLNRRSKWHEERVPVKAGDIVYITDESSRKKWIRGIIEDVIVAKDGSVRQAVVRTKSGVYKRPVTKLAVVEVPTGPSGSKAGPQVVLEPDVRAGDC